MTRDARAVSFRALFQEMATVWRDAPAPEGVHLVEHTRAALADVEATAVVYGWMMRVIRNGEAALQLVDAGYGPEASPLIRSMIEHAIGLWWIVDQPGAAFQALTRARSETMRRLHAAQATGWVIGDDESQRLLQEAINIVTDEDTRAVDRLLHIAHQAAQYNLGRLYQA